MSLFSSVVISIIDDLQPEAGKGKRVIIAIQGKERKRIALPHAHIVAGTKSRRAPHHWREPFSKEGDYMFPQEKDCRYRDIIQEIGVEELPYGNVPFLVCLLLIKMRLMNTHESALARMKYLFDDEKYGIFGPIDEVKDGVK